MASQKQIQANRRNARRSTGPKTPKGKAAVSRNAVKHGLSSSRTIVLPEENRQEFEKHLEAFRSECEPQGPLEQSLVFQGVEGMIHIGDLAAEKRLTHPRGVLIPGEKVRALVLEVADGVFATCRLTGKQQAGAEAAADAERSDLASMTARLAARWRQGKAAPPEPARAGQIRSFRVSALDPGAKLIELELLS